MSLENGDILWKAMENLWESMGNRFFLKIDGKLWKTYGKSMGHLWEIDCVFENLWKAMESLWKIYGTSMGNRLCF